MQESKDNQGQRGEDRFRSAQDMKDMPLSSIGYGEMSEMEETRMTPEVWVPL